jgi:N-acetyl-gamma-glutamyl-phosphate reductase
LRGVCGDDAFFCKPDEADWKKCDAVFFALPHGASMEMIPNALAAGALAVDIGADFRFADAAEWERIYGVKHAAPDLLERAAYGLSEFNRAKIAKADIIACPGCYAAAAELALIPPLAAGAIAEDGIIIDAKSGVSGAGRRAERSDLLFAEVAGNVKAYSVGAHRHLPEITGAVSLFSGSGDKKIAAAFAPHLLPLARGIYASVYCRCVSGASAQDAHRALCERYNDERFVDVLAFGEMPQLASVAGSNICRIGVADAGGGAVLIVSALDNLTKGAAGAAVQNLNIRFGFDEAAGLSTGVAPL